MKWEDVEVVEDTYVKNGPVELSRSAAVRLSGARPSHRIGVATTAHRLVTIVANAERSLILDASEATDRY